ncbi:uncharacterized protein si:ch73-100l22.3 isoform X2 [Betta splendens]|uniref:Uncharacterized protein si:ch73-100l22.3 isoform X2 n=1 Tax=Betta splendens TaxID=158456 RepID=A0A9W2XQT5_BETSP|nr:uncharacterized protein si:ch73-100l22.3 isoform X2 [Betta splendens]
MEDYDKFVRHRLSQLSKSEEERHSKASTASSLICFHGRAILPPLLSEEQRGEMQRHRDAAQKAADHRMLKNETRMAYVQTILHSVQIRKTPTLEELLRESEIVTRSSQNNLFEGEGDIVSLLPPPVENGKDGLTLPSMTSTTYCAFLTSNATPSQSHNGYIFDHLNGQSSQPGSFNGVSYQSESSGYLTQKNDGSVNHDFFLHNTSNTIAKMPDIISYPPIDGQELERTGLESSFSNSIKVQDIGCTLLKKDSVIWDNFLSENIEDNYLDCTGGEKTPPLTVVLDLDRNHSFDKCGAIEVSDNSPELTSTLGSHHCPQTVRHVQNESNETKPADGRIEEAEPSEEPYRLSLQALLTKSQEYRRRQRMLRNQAKNTKIQEKNQELERAKAEEQSHSDKENDEFPFKGPVTVEEMQCKDRRCSSRPTTEISTKNSLVIERMNDSEVVGKNMNIKSESTYSAGDEKTSEVPSVEEEVVFNNKLNSSREVIAGPKIFSALLQQTPISKDTSLVQEAFYLTSSPTASYKGARKYHSIPVPNLCRSPVHYKSRGTSKDREAADKANREKALGESGLKEDHKIDEESSLGHQNIHTALASPASAIVGSSEMIGMDLTMNSQHIDQLESNLSSLKVLISDLESTVKKNLETHSQTENDTQNECSFKGTEQIKNDQLLQQSACGYLEQKLSEDGDGIYTEYRQKPSRESSSNCQNTHDDKGPSLCDTDDLPLIVQGKGCERINISELRLVKAITLDRQKTTKTEKEKLSKTYNCKKQQPAAKCLLSTAQQMRIPDVFRNVPSNLSVLSDTSNHIVDRRNDTAGKDHDSTHTSSLNHSYDVETPSNLWLLEQSGSDSKGLVAQEHHLTPKSEGEGQGSVSKVKRRLLLCGTQDRSPDASGGANSVVRASVPRAPVQVCGGHGSQKDRQDQLKQVHAAQIKALQDEHRRQQQELLQRVRAG